MAQVIWGAEKSHDLPSASWRPKKACVVQRPESLEADGVDFKLHWRPENQACQCSRSISQTESRFNLPLPFCSLWALRKMVNAHPHWGEPSALHSSPIQMSIFSGNTFTDTPEIMFTQLSGPSQVDTEN